MKRLIDKLAKKADQIPMPVGGRILLTLYWWGWKLFGPGRDWNDYDEVIKALNTPLKVQAWLWANIAYTLDKEDKDHWQPARVTFERRKGDCLPYNTYIPFIDKKTGLLQLRKIGHIVENKLEGKAVSFSFKTGKLSFQDIISHQKKGTKQVYSVILSNGRTIEATGNHRFFTMNNKGQPSEIRVKELKPGNMILGVSGSPPCNKPSDKPDLLWVDGLYIADGWSDGGHVCIGKKKKAVMDKLKKILRDNNIPFSFRDRTGDNRTSYVNFKESWYKDRLKKMGKDVPTKRFLNEHLSLPAEQMLILIDGYSEDAYKKPKRVDNTDIIYVTSSDMVAKQLVFMHNILGQPLHIEWRKDSGGAGKNPLPIWRLYHNPTADFKKLSPLPYEWIKAQAKKIFPGIGSGTGGHNKKGKSPKIQQYNSIKKERVNALIKQGIDLSDMEWALKPNIEWFKVKYVSRANQERTYDIEVKNNHNFLLWNDILAHNCEDWAIFANNCLKKKYDGCFLCMYTKKEGHATYLIEREKKGTTQRWTSVGTFGHKSHKGKDYGDIIPNWHGYKKWKKYTVKNENLKNIKERKK